MTDHRTTRPRAPAAPVLPTRTLADEVHIACVAQEWDRLASRLRADAPNEACVFTLTAPSRGPQRTTVLLRDAIWPEPGEVEATPYSLELSESFISRAIDTAIDGGPKTGLALVHTHPYSHIHRGDCEFSPRDNGYELRLFPTITRRRPEGLSASIVIGERPSDIDARVWWQGPNGLSVQDAHAVRHVGPTLTVWETPHSKWTDHPDPELMDRSTRVWGEQGRRIMQNLRVGIVGAGGTGSIVLLTSATMGVGKIGVWDRDVIDKKNLHRLLGAKMKDVGKNKARILVENAKQFATASPADIKAHEDWGTTESSLRELRDCDVVFSCVDKFAPRVALNDLAYAHLIPVIDMGSKIFPTKDEKSIEAILTHAQVFTPGMPCAWGNETLTPAKLVAEAQGSQRNAERRIPYGLPLTATEGVEPSVLPLNTAGVGLAMLLFMQIVCRVTTETPLGRRLILPKWELTDNDLRCLPGCDHEAVLALGEQATINPVIPPA